MAKRLTEGVRCRGRVIPIFPNEATVIRWVGVILIELSEQWTTEKRCFTLDELAKHTAADQATVPVQLGLLNFVRVDGGKPKLFLAQRFLGVGNDFTHS